MDTNDTEPTPRPDAAQAFDTLRREVALMRRVIETMADEQRAAPDYSDTLGKMAEGLTRSANALAWLKTQPAVQTTAQDMAQQIRDAGTAARAADRQVINEAADALRDTIRSLSAWIATARQAEVQDRRLLQTGGGAAAVGLVLGVLLALAALRTFPETGAAWVMDMGRWSAGERLLRSADPKQWAEVRAFTAIGRDNREAVAACRKDVERTGREQRCRIVVAAPKPPIPAQP